MRTFILLIAFFALICHVSNGKKSSQEKEDKNEPNKPIEILKNIARHFIPKGYGFADDIGREVWAIAEFHGDVSGEVVVDEDGDMEINLDVSLLDESICKEYSYHVYNKWDSDDMTTRYGDECGSIIGEEHLDPFGTGICCDELDNVDEIGYFNCEMGDLSGRFGTVSPNDEGILFMQGMVASSMTHSKSDGRISPEVLYKKSVAFECKDNVKDIVVCAPFNVRVYDYDQPIYQKLKKK